MEKIKNCIKKVCTQHSVELIRIENVESLFLIDEEMWLPDMIVVCIDAQNIADIYNVLGDFAQNFDKITTNVNIYKDDGAHATIEIMKNPILLRK